MSQQSLEQVLQKAGSPVKLLKNSKIGAITRYVRATGERLRVCLEEALRV